MKSVVVRHGTRFLLTEPWEGLRGVQSPVTEVIISFDQHLSQRTPSTTRHFGHYTLQRKGIDLARAIRQKISFTTIMLKVSTLHEPVGNDLFLRQNIHFDPGSAARSCRTMAVSVRFYFRFRKRAKAPASQTHISLHRGRARGSSRFRNRASL